MLKYAFLKKSKSWAVIGPADEVRVGPAHVQRSNGDFKPERIIKVSKPFATADGQQLRYGFLAILPRG